MKLLTETDSSGVVANEQLVGQQVTHIRTQNRYKIIGIAYDCDEDLWKYLYQSVDGGTIYTRSTWQMRKKFEGII